MTETETDRETDFGSTDDEPTIRAAGSVVGGRGASEDDDDEEDTEEEDEEEGDEGLVLPRKGGTLDATGFFKGRRAAGDVRMASP